MGKKEQTIISFLFAGKIRLIDTLMELQKRESTDLPFLKKQLAETEKSINNMLNAIQAGIFTLSTKQRLDELEETKSQLEISILQEEMHKPMLTREQIAFFIYRTFNYKDGSKTITLAEVEGSDLSVVGAVWIVAENTRFYQKTWCFRLFYIIGNYATAL